MRGAVVGGALALLMASACGKSGASQTLRFEPGIVDFGAVPAGRQAQAKTALLQNVGAETAEIFGVDIQDEAGRVADELDLSGLPAELAPGMQHTVDVSLRDAAIGARRLTARLRTAADAERLSLLYFGVAAQVAAIPDHLDFGTVKVGETSTASFHLENRGSEEVKLEALSFDPETPSAFRATLAGVTRIPPGGFAEVTVYFRPPGPAEYVGAIRPVGAGLPAQSIPLSGDAASAWVSVRPETLSFGQVGIGDVRTATVEVVNQAPARRQMRVVVRSLADGAYTVGGVLASTVAVTLEAYERRTAAVRFAPAAPSDVSGVVVLEEDTGGRFVFNLFGTGNSPTNGSLLRGQAEVDFGRIPLGTTATLSFTVSNVGTGPAELLSAPWIDPPNPALRLSTERPMPMVSAQDVRRIDVHFRPLAEGTLLGEKVRVDVNAGASVEVAIKGSGGLGHFPRLALPGRYDAGNVAPGLDAIRRIPLRNLGDRPLSIRGVRLTQPAPEVVSVISYSPIVPPGEVGRLDLRWDAAAVPSGDLSATAHIESDDPTLPSAELPLTATRADPGGLPPYFCVSSTVGGQELEVHLVRSQSFPLDAPFALDRCSNNPSLLRTDGDPSCIALALPNDQALVVVTRAGGEGTVLVRLEGGPSPLPLTERLLPPHSRWDVLRISSFNVEHLGLPLIAFDQAECD
ncbi:MAG: choice-of-anchor D domain-containing protein [Myxococcota bacterium]